MNKLKIFVFSFILFLLSLNLTFITFSEAKIYKRDDNAFVSPFADIAVTGDSYAEKFCQFENGKSYNFIDYAKPGHTVLENLDEMIPAALSPCKVVIISIGVNDHNKQTPPAYFEAGLKMVLDQCALKNKVVIMHTYMPYPTIPENNNIYDVPTYDIIIRNLADFYHNAHYIDTLHYYTYETMATDFIHYNKDFYDRLYNDIINLLQTVDLNE